MQRMYRCFCLDCVMFLRSERNGSALFLRSASRLPPDRKSEAGSIFAEDRAPLRSLHLE